MKTLQLVILSALTGLFSACTPVGKVQVMDRATGQPIAGAMVRAEIYHLMSPFKVEIQETDSQGVAKFRGSCASALFIAGKPGYLPVLGGPGSGRILLTRGVTFSNPSPRRTEESSEAELLIKYQLEYGANTPSRLSDHYSEHTSLELWDRWRSYLRSFPLVW